MKQLIAIVFIVTLLSGCLATTQVSQERAKEIRGSLKVMNEALVFTFEEVKKACASQNWSTDRCMKMESLYPKLQQSHSAIASIVEVYSLTSGSQTTATRLPTWGDLPTE